MVSTDMLGMISLTMLTNLQVNQAKGEAGMLETRKAYEYALDRIGLDLHSAGLWHEYINYMQLPRPNTPAYRALWVAGAAPGQEDSQRIMTLRSNIYRISLAVYNDVLQLKAHLNRTDKPPHNVWTLARTITFMYASVGSLPCHSRLTSPKLHMLCCNSCTASDKSYLLDEEPIHVQVPNQVH